MRPFAYKLWFLGLALMLGCGAEPDKIKVVAVTGTVTLDGQPLDDAMVSFLPQTAQGVAAAATTDAKGRYSLQTAGVRKQGAAPGEYKVIIMKTEVKQLRTEEEALSQVKSQGPMAMPPPTNEARQVLPEKYRNPAQSGFAATVSESGDNSFDFELKSK